MRRYFLFLVIVCVGAATWIVQRVEGRSLHAQLRAAKSARAELDAACAEQQRLRAAFPPDAELRAVQAAAAEAQRLREQQAAFAARSATALSASPVGEWSQPTSWRDRGAAAPRAAVETALWAASGGDTARLGQLLELPGDVRSRAEAIVAQLSPAARAQYPTAEALIAAFTIKRIPIGPAQIVWAQEADPDVATLCVFVRDPAVQRPVATPDPQYVDPAPMAPPMTREEAIAKALAEAERRKAERGRGIPPPQTPAQTHTTLAYLSLRRSNDGWRLQVPANAVDRIARELGVGGAR